MQDRKEKRRREKELKNRNKTKKIRSFQQVFIFSNVIAIILVILVVAKEYP